MHGPQRTEVIVLGAGIAGLALAARLAERNVRVTVVDPGPRIGGASGRAAGIVTEQLWNDWDIAVTRETHADARRMLAGTSPRAYWRNGFLRFTRNPALAEPLQQAAARLRGSGADAVLVDGARMAELVPGARFVAPAWGLYSEDDGCVTPSAFADAYAARGEAAGVVLRDSAGPVELAHEGDDWEARTSRGKVRAPRAVVAAGAWSKELLRSVGHPLPLCPYRMQAALLRPSVPPGEEFPSVHDIDTDVYVRPELGGRILAGDGTESTEADPTRYVRGGDPAFVAHLAESLDGPFPTWGAGEVVSAWAGVCTSTRDRRPLVGPVPEANGLFVMTGFNGFGIMRAGGVAGRLADALATDDDRSYTWATLAPVLPSRFAGESQDFPPRPGFTLEGGDAPRF